MTQQRVSRRMFHVNVKRRILWRVSTLRKHLRALWAELVACWIGKSSSIKYRHLSFSSATSSFNNSASRCRTLSLPRRPSTDSSSDLVRLKVCLLGDCSIGKTTFLSKYAGGGREEVMNPVDKTLSVQGARISYRMWEVTGDDSSMSNIAAPCQDSVAMLFMFDLTSRCTLKSVITWYQQARKYNQTAILVLIGTKFDDFVQLPIDLQWTIASQARAYAKALNATLFFSSATYNINVNKVFKYITAKLFNLSWNLERNLIIGEPTIDF